MNKTAIIISVIAIIVSGYVYAYKTSNLGVQMTQPYSYYGATNASSTAPVVATTTNPVLTKDANRNNARVCNISAYPVFLHPMNEATTTGVVSDEGIYLSPFGLTTSTQICQDFPGFKGYLFSISVSATGTLSVSSW